MIDFIYDSQQPMFFLPTQKPDDGDVHMGGYHNFNGEMGG